MLKARCRFARRHRIEHGLPPLFPDHLEDIAGHKIDAFLARLFVDDHIAHLHGHYLLWLQSVGLTTRPLGDALTDEGRAVLVMLASTRSATSAPLPIGLATLDPRMGLDHGATREERERVLAAHEAFAQDLPARFVRAAIAGQPGITLVAEQRGRNIPLTRVLWSQVFPDDHARDRLYAWLAGRIDRWEVWADLAEHKGSQALSDRLLLLAFADRPAGPEG